MSDHEYTNREPWMDAPVSPLTDEQAEALAAAQVADPGWQPNEAYLTRDDSLLMHGETAAQAIEEVARLRAVSVRMLKESYSAPLTLVPISPLRRERR